MKLKRVVLFILVTVFMLNFTACKSPVYKAMVKELKADGTYSSEYSKYSIDLGNDVEYYFFEDSDNVWLNLYKYYGVISSSFHIAFNSEMDGEYSWTMRYDKYELRGTLTASTIDKNTESLSYNVSDSKVPTDITTKNNLRKLAATYCLTCLLSLEIYWTKTGSNLSVADLGFNF